MRGADDDFLSAAQGPTLAGWNKEERSTQNPATEEGGKKRRDDSCTLSITRKGCLLVPWAMCDGGGSFLAGRMGEHFGGVWRPALPFYCHFCPRCARSRTKGMFLMTGLLTVQ